MWMMAAACVCGLFLCLVPAIPASGATPSQAEDYGNGNIYLDATYGYQDMAKSGRYLPLTVRVDNRGGEAFSGKLCILTMESDYQIYRYEYPLEISAGGSEERAASISLGARIDQMYIKVTDNDGTEVAQKRLKINVNTDTAELFVGILSDTPDRLQYMNGVGVSYSTLRTRTIVMNADSLPTQELGLDQLDVLLITNFNTAVLTGDQVEAIWAWVQKGGVLLFGTGARAQDTMYAFKAALIDTPFPEPDMQDINMGVEFAADGPSGATISLECTDIFMNGANEVLSSDELSVLTSVPVGNGMVAAAIYDFVDIEHFCQEHISYVDNLFTQLLGNNRISFLARAADGTASSQYWSVQSLINTGDINRLPRIGLYLVVSIAYVALVGPGLYFFLKQRGLRRYYHLSVITLALCTTGMVYVMGIATRFHGPFFTYATIKDVDEGAVSETTFLNMQAPYNKPFAVELDPAYMVHPVTRSAYYDMAPVPKFTGAENPAVSLKYQEDCTRISVRNVGAFNPKYFQLERKVTGQDNQGFTGEIQFFDGQMTGTLTNNYSQPLDDVAILLYNQMVLVDHMEAGQTVRLDGRKVIYGSMNYGYAMAEQITGASRYKEGDIGDASYVQSLQRSNLLSFYMSNYLVGYHTDAKVVGFSQEKQGVGFLKKAGYETYGSTLITSSVKVDYRRGRLVYRSALQKEPNVLSGSYMAASNTMYGMTPLMLEYFLGNDTEVEKVEFHSLSDKMAESLRYNYTVPFVGNMYFYNYDTGNYDPKDMKVQEYDRAALGPYLSPGNTLTVKYVYTSTDDYSWNIMLPILTVIGRSK